MPTSRHFRISAFLHYFCKHLVWRVPASAHAPHGFNYSLMFVMDGKRGVGYLA